MCLRSLGSTLFSRLTTARSFSPDQRITSSLVRKILIANCQPSFDALITEAKTPLPLIPVIEQPFIMSPIEGRQYPSSSQKAVALNTPTCSGFTLSSSSEPKRSYVFVFLGSINQLKNCWFWASTSCRNSSNCYISTCYTCASSCTSTGLCLSAIAFINCLRSSYSILSCISSSSSSDSLNY